MYLNADSVEATLRVVASCARGSEIALSYNQGLVERCGLTVVDHPTADDLFTRYCAGRRDGLRPYTLERLLGAANNPARQPRGRCGPSG
jgi:hypothetical protein